MAVKAGAILHVGNGETVIERIQTGGPGQLNIPIERIYETGNYKSVATIRDTPDLQFSLESFDVSTDIERLITQIETGAVDLSRAKPTDFASQWKAGQDASDPFAVVASVGVPFLVLESMSYRFGLSENATQSASLRGDSIFYNPGPTFIEETPGTGTAGQVIETAQPAFEVAEGETRRILSVTAGSRRLAYGVDYTETSGAPTGGAAVTTITLNEATDETIRIMYASPSAKSYPQSVHSDPAVKPAAIRGKRDVEVYVGGYDPADPAGSAVNKLLSVQSVNLDWRQNIERDEEFGNAYAVAIEGDNPAVNGTVEIKPRDPDHFMSILRKITGADPDKVIGPSTAVPLPLDVVLKHPDTGNPLKRLHVPDARFTAPGYQARVQTRTTVQLQYESDEGTLLIYDT